MFDGRLDQPFTVELERNMAVVERVDVDPRELDPEESLQLCPGAGGSLEWRAASSPTVAAANGCGPSMMMPDCAVNDPCCESVGVTCDAFDEAYIKASNTGVEDMFGTSVAVSGNTLVIGTPFEDSSARGIDGDQRNEDAADSGAVYVFIREGSDWSQQAYLKSSNSDGSSPESAADWFGFAVAIDGDTLVVGAPQESGNATGVNGDESNNDLRGTGAAYVFTRSGTTWTQEAYLKPSNTSPPPTPSDGGDAFGAAVAVQGDLVVVAAPREDGGSAGIDGEDNDDARRSGAVYAFTRSNGSWRQTAYIKPTPVNAFAEFGTSLDLDGTTLVVGAPRESTTGPFRGAAYAFELDMGDWI